MKDNEVMSAKIHQGTSTRTPITVGLMLEAQPAVAARRVSPLVENPEGLVLVAKLTAYKAQLEVFA